MSSECPTQVHALATPSVQLKQVGGGAAGTYQDFEASNDGAPDVEALLGAFVLPAVGLMRDLGPRARHLARLLPRIEARFKARPGFRVTDMYSVLFAVATST